MENGIFKINYDNILICPKFAIKNMIITCAALGLWDIFVQATNIVIDVGMCFTCQQQQKTESNSHLHSLNRHCFLSVWEKEVQWLYKVQSIFSTKNIFTATFYIFIKVSLKMLYAYRILSQQKIFLITKEERSKAAAGKLNIISKVCISH